MLQVKILFNIATWHNIVACFLAIVNPGAICFPFYIYAHIGTPFQENPYYLFWKATIFTTSYNIPWRCFAVMTSEPAIYLMSVLWSCCQHCNLYLLWILKWKYMGFSSSSFGIDSKHCIYIQRVPKWIFLHLLLSLSDPVALHASHIIELVVTELALMLAASARMVCSTALFKLIKR